MTLHPHTWSVLASTATGVFSKRDQPNDPSSVVVKGVVFKCRTCNKMILEPDNLKYQTVEVE